MLTMGSDIESESPRKKPKLEKDFPNDREMAFLPEAPDSASAQTEAPHLDKEAACGITEFVSPDFLGFTGILKKRYARLNIHR